jgi:predicted nucleotidyltransferase
MLPFDEEFTDLQAFIQNDPSLSKSLITERDLIVQKGFEQLFSERVIRENISKKYSEIAETFVSQLKRRSGNVKLMAVCGSVAYGNAVESDDIDLFLITEKNRLWLFILRGLILARAFNIKAAIYGKKTNFCLSYVADERHIEDEIMHNRSKLFARELLSTRVLVGKNYYNKLLERAKWIRHLYPKLYFSKLTMQQNETVPKSDGRLQIITKDILDLLVFAALGNYLSLAAFRLNLKYRKKRKMHDLFEAKISKSSCVYTSKRYHELERIYRSI